MKLFLVDGTFELFRCFHGAPRASAPDGREVGATRGLLHSLLALFRKQDATHMAVAFDRAVAPVRVSNPRTDDALLQSQFGLAADAARALGIAIWPMVRVQADDAVATGVARFAGRPGLETVIASADLDFTQCLTHPSVQLLNRNTGTTLDGDGVRERFGVEPAQIPSYLALVGDVSDGLPGLPGWGAKSAAAVLRRYETIEAIPDDPNGWDVSVRGKERLATTLRERRLEAILYRDLSILRTDVPIPHTFDDLEWHGADRETLTELCATLGETELLARVPRFR